MSQTPRAAAQETVTNPVLPGGIDERFTGFGVLGLPFGSGHYLALRCWPATSIGPAYSAVFARTPGGEWTIHSDAPPDLSCPRYLSSAVSNIAAPRPIEVEWGDPYGVRIRIEDVLDWRVTFGDTAATKIMSSCAAAMPDRAWTSPGVLSAMSAMAGPMLGIGRIRLAGNTPNRQWFKVAPKRMWAVVDSSASWQGRDLGAPAPLPAQAHLADLWLPQKGIGYVGTAVFERLDAARHLVAG